MATLSKILDNRANVKFLLLVLFSLFHTFGFSGEFISVFTPPSTPSIELLSNPLEIDSYKTFELKNDLTFSDVIDRISFFNGIDRNFVYTQNIQIQISYNDLLNQVLTYNKPIFFHQRRIPSANSEEDLSLLFHS